VGAWAETVEWARKTKDKRWTGSGGGEVRSADFGTNAQVCCTMAIALRLQQSTCTGVSGTKITLLRSGTLDGNSYHWHHNAGAAAVFGPDRDRSTRASTDHGMILWISCCAETMPRIEPDTPPGPGTSGSARLSPPAVAVHPRMYLLRSRERDREHISSGARRAVLPPSWRYDQFRTFGLLRITAREVVATEYTASVASPTNSRHAVLLT
jgi:hypothetical protein